MYLCTYEYFVTLYFVNLMFSGPCIIVIVDEWKNQLDVTCCFYLLCTQHVSDINISIFRSLRLCWWITTSVVLFSVCCVLEFLLRLIFGGVRFAGWSTSASTCKTNTTKYQPQQKLVLQPAKRAPQNISRSKKSNTQRTENKTTDVVIHQHSRKLLKMDILMSETYWAHNKWNKIASIIKLVFHSSALEQFQSSDVLPQKLLANIYNTGPYSFFYIRLI